MNENNHDDRVPNMNIEAGFQAPDGTMITLSVSLKAERCTEDAEQALVDIALDPRTWIHVLRTFNHAAHNADPNQTTMFEMDSQGNHHKIPSTVQ